MKKLIQLTSLTILLIFASGCSNVLDSLSTTTTPKINQSAPTVNYSSIKSLPDMTSIGFEWQKVDDPRVIGYNFYRTEISKGETTLKLIAKIDSKHATHYVDRELEPKTKYAYQISSRLSDGSESPTTEAYIAETLPRIKPVAFAQAISNLPKKIKLLWEPHPDQRVSYYRVEKYNTTLNEWIYLATINQRLSAEYIDTGLSNASKHKYRVKAFTFDDVESAPTNVLEAVTKPAPKSVSGVKASNNIPKKIFLTWSASPTSDVVQYEIHRSSYESFGYKKIATINASILEYTDELNEDGLKYYYKIIPIDKDGLDGIFDIPAIKGETLGKPTKPNLTQASIQGGVAVLNWSSSPRAVSYIVTKKTKQNFFQYKSTKFENISGTSFQDSDVVSGIDYKYSVQSVDEFGVVSESSNEVSLTRK
ncbi:fibronectin type III domain-containing protein [Aliarcobacter faecis]|uniref:fibronectin type III domain-containing protein n=1 Tax=Aliarcobacter faecis TaxID=1564138 RepID=UPI00047C67DE|nr:fibronectin type III domain-containing protein [Aliarcobacter faecis]QKF73116.1 fibronectin type III domain-containing protein [Aliarcobacter faecis]